MDKPTVKISDVRKAQDYMPGVLRIGQNLVNMGIVKIVPNTDLFYLPDSEFWSRYQEFFEIDWTS